MGEVCRKAGISAFLALGARPKTSGVMLSLGQSISNVSLRITRSVLLNSLRRSILAFG